MTDLEIADDVVKAHVLLLKTSNLLFKHSESRLKKLGITRTQHAVLMTLSVLDHPPTITALGRRLLRSKNDLTTVIDHMERDGLVQRQRDQTDRRTIRVVTTAKGKALLEGLRASSRQLVYEAMSCLSEPELGQLTGLLQKIGKNVSRQGAAAS